ncbi:M66 family metalloprotease [Thalassolituus sp. LLYu03]|uniref:M66 family metalloprotease n=1 Tax=Thalassolituus sp. LLYu03 TaxID=3421656 RepID=UPI003D26FDB3
MITIKKGTLILAVSVLTACGGATTDSTYDPDQNDTVTDTTNPGGDSSADDNSPQAPGSGADNNDSGGSENGGNEESGGSSGEGSSGDGSSGDGSSGDGSSGDGSSGDGSSGDGSSGDGSSGDGSSGDGSSGDGSSGDGSSGDGSSGDGSSGDGSSTDTETPAKTEHVTFAPAVTTAFYSEQPVFTGAPAGAVFSALSLPSWAALDAASGRVTGTPDEAGAAAIQIQAAADDDIVVYSGTLDVALASAYLGGGRIDFYGLDFDGNPRVLRNDLSGDLAAEIQFVQSHSVAPHDNYVRNTSDETLSRYMPRLVAQRDALVLFIANDDLPRTEVTAELSVNGGVVDTIALRHPNTLPAPDNFAGQMTYSGKAWWGVIPWQHVRTGMALTFTSEGRSGLLAATDIDVGRATELVNQTIRVGMLTNPPASNDNHYASNDPVMAAADYFSTMPVARVVMANYADATLNKVMIGSGVIYDEISAGNGDVYSGDMRGDVAKSQISVGINMANYGYPSWNMSQSYGQPFKEVTSHHAQGNYQNGVVHHGLSGGNGIATLYSTSGNEASHEWGHGYGLGHYPGQGLTTDGRWANHHANSGWGYIPYRQRLRTPVTSISEGPVFTYNKDAMSGGWDGSPLSRYTYYTGYSSRIIQNQMESFAIPDASYASGYKKWNTVSGEFDEYVSNIPAPVKTGVAVATILGAHDPLTDLAVIYPVFHGNYGNVFDLAEPDLSGSDDVCWLDIQNAAGDEKRIAVAASRHASGSANQLHVNLEAGFRPTLATLNCRRSGTVTELARSEFDGEIPALPPVGIAGMDMGMSQLKTREFVEIDAALDSLADGAVGISASLQVKIASYDAGELLAALSAGNAAKLDHVLSVQAAATATRALLNHAAANGLSDEATAARLLAHLQASGLLGTETLGLTGTAITGSGYFFDPANGEDGQVALTSQSGVAADDRPQWIQDSYGRLHPVASPWLCLVASSSVLYTKACDVDAVDQRWGFYGTSTNPWVLKNASSGACLDRSGTTGGLITYGCHGGGNQRWYGITSSDENWLSVLGASELKEVARLLM